MKKTSGVDAWFSLGHRSLVSIYINTFSDNQRLAGLYVYIFLSKSTGQTLLIALSEIRWPFDLAQCILVDNTLTYAHTGEHPAVVQYIHDYNRTCVWPHVWCEMFHLNNRQVIKMYICDRSQIYIPDIVKFANYVSYR